MTAASVGILIELEASPDRCATVAALRCALYLSSAEIESARCELADAGLVSRGRIYGAPVLVLVAPGAA